MPDALGKTIADSIRKSRQDRGLDPNTGQPIEADPKPNDNSHWLEMIKKILGYNSQNQ